MLLTSDTVPAFFFFIFESHPSILMTVKKQAHISKPSSEGQSYLFWANDLASYYAQNNGFWFGLIWHLYIPPHWLHV